MTQATLHDVGEEYIFKTGITSQTLTVGLFNKGQDDLSDSDDIGSITTEPNGANYSRQSADFEPTDYSAAFNDDWGFVNINDITFDVSDSSNTVDSYFITTTFQSDDKGDSSPQLHLISTGYLKKPRNLNDGTRQISSINLPANTIGVRLGPRLDGDKFYYVDENTTDGTILTETISPFDITSVSNTVTDDLESGVTEYYVEFDITGYKMLVTRSDGQVNQYILQEPYDVSTRELDATVSLAGSNEIWTAIWNNDGTRLYETSASVSLYQHEVNNRFDATSITSTTLIDDNLNNTPAGACWNDDGTKYYYIAQGGHGSGESLNDQMITFTLNTPWDLTTITNTETRDNFFSNNETTTVTSPIDYHSGVRFKYDGSILYLADRSEGDSHQYNLAQIELDTPFDVSTDTNISLRNPGSRRVYGITLNTLPKYLGAG